MAAQQPLRPDELDQRADQVSDDVAPAGDPLEPGSATRGEMAPPGLIIGLILLVIFVAILGYAIVLPALG